MNYRRNTLLVFSPLGSDTDIADMVFMFCYHCKGTENTVMSPKY